MGSSRSGLLVNQKLPREWISREVFNTYLEPFGEPFWGCPPPFLEGRAFGPFS
jgi:hypothetical protein